MADVMLEGVVLSGCGCMLCSVSPVCTPLMHSLGSAWYDELKLLKGNHVCRSNTYPDMKTHVNERLATDHY